MGEVATAGRALHGRRRRAFHPCNELNDGAMPRPREDTLSDDAYPTCTA